MRLLYVKVDCRVYKGGGVESSPVALENRLRFDPDCKTVTVGRRTIKVRCLVVLVVVVVVAVVLIVVVTPIKKRSDHMGDRLISYVFRSVVPVVAGATKTRRSFHLHIS